MLPRWLKPCFAFIAAASLGTAALAADLTVIVPYPPGSSPDRIARLLAQKMTAAGKAVVVDNKSGANALVGSEFVYRAKPDGATLLLVDRMTIVVNPLLLDKMPFDPAKFVPVSDLAKVDLMVAARTDAPFNNWAEFVSYAKANPAKVSVGTGGVGSVHHLSLELLQRRIGARFNHIPYRGLGPAMNDLIGKQLDVMFAASGTLQPQIGKVKVLATGADARAPAFADAPTLRELGVDGLSLLPTTFSLFAPPETPKAVVDDLNRQVRRVLTDPDTTATLLAAGLTSTPSTPQEVTQGLEKLAPALQQIVREANIKVQ